MKKEDKDLLLKDLSARLPYEEWKRKTKIGISAFKGATGVK